MTKYMGQNCEELVNLNKGSREFLILLFLFIYFDGGTGD